MPTTRNGACAEEEAGCAFSRPKPAGEFRATVRMDKRGMGEAGTLAWIALAMLDYRRCPLTGKALQLSSFEKSSWQSSGFALNIL